MKPFKDWLEDKFFPGIDLGDFTDEQLDELEDLYREESHGDTVQDDKRGS